MHQGFAEYTNKTKINKTKIKFIAFKTQKFPVL